MEIFIEVVKSWGPPGLLALIMWWQLEKAEKREETLHLRNQLLENKLLESYDERIEAASQITEAMISTSTSSKELKATVDRLMEQLQRKK